MFHKSPSTKSTDSVDGWKSKWYCELMQHLTYNCVASVEQLAERWNCPDAGLTSPLVHTWNLPGWRNSWGWSGYTCCLFPHHWQCPLCPEWGHPTMAVSATWLYFQPRSWRQKETRSQSSVLYLLLHAYSVGWNIHCLTAVGTRDIIRKSWENAQIVYTSVRT